MVENVLSVRGVSKSFAGVQALSDIDLDIRPGEVHCLAGENGSGKSTLIKVISGVHDPDAGVDRDQRRRRIVACTPVEAIAAGVQVIYQDFSVFPNLTVMENLALNDRAGQQAEARQLAPLPPDRGAGGGEDRLLARPRCRWSASSRWQTASWSPSAGR